MKKESFFLVFVATGVFSVSLGYGFIPNHKEKIQTT